MAFYELYECLFLHTLIKMTRKGSIGPSVKEKLFNKQEQEQRQKKALGVLDVFLYMA